MSTVPRSASTTIGRSAETAPQSPGTPTMAGIPKDRAMIVACDVGPPRSRAIARTRRGSSRAASAGESSSATRIEPRGNSRPMRSAPPASWWAISRATSEMSAARSRSALDSAVSSRRANSWAAPESAHSALTRSRRTRSATDERNVSSPAMSACASRIAATSDPMPSPASAEWPRSASAARRAARRKRRSSSSNSSGETARRNVGVPSKRTTTARPTATPGETERP